LVSLDKIEKGNNQVTFDWATGDMIDGSKALYYKSIDKMTPNGIFGNPLLASIEKGEKITKAVIKALLEITTNIYDL
jgi:creatinine amidohydrolase/Fe(II)-dependent formamide hydrolase-like protein